MLVVSSGRGQARAPRRARSGGDCLYNSVSSCSAR